MQQSYSDLPFEDRLPLFLRRQFTGPGRDKIAARRLGVSPRTVRHWFDGVFPGAAAWRNIARELGRDAVLAVFEPEFDETKARLAAEIRALEETLDARKAALRSVAGDQEGVAQPPHRRR